MKVISKKELVQKVNSKIRNSMLADQWIKSLENDPPIDSGMVDKYSPIYYASMVAPYTENCISRRLYLYKFYRKQMGVLVTVGYQVKEKLKRKQREYWRYM